LGERCSDPSRKKICMQRIMDQDNELQPLSPRKKFWIGTNLGSSFTAQCLRRHLAAVTQ
jgi:hypothetical protein